LFISSSVEILAFNKTGDAVLVAFTESGPEGGGSSSYSVLGPADAVQARVSSDFSPGGGDTPETIPVGDCKKAVKALADAVLARGFEGITVRPEKCAGERYGVVEVAEASRAKPRALEDLGEVTVTDRPGGIEIHNAAGDLSVGGSEHGHVTAWRQAAGPLVVLQYATLGPDRAATVYLNVAGAPVEARFPWKGSAL
jgi:hypothetical protein